MHSSRSLLLYHQSPILTPLFLSQQFQNLNPKPMAGGNNPPPPNSNSNSNSKPSFPNSSQKHHHHHHHPSTSTSTPPNPNPKSNSKPSPIPNHTPTPTHNNHNHNNNNKPRPLQQNPIAPPRPFHEPPPPPSYGFHMLERRSLILADGSVRSYFALPPNYENISFNPIPIPIQHPLLNFPPPRFPISPDVNRNPWKRKLGDEERENDGLERHRQQLLQYGNASGPGRSQEDHMRVSKSLRIHEFSGSASGSKVSRHSEVDQGAFSKAFLHFVKLVFESGKKTYLADGKQGPVACLACSSNRSSKNFPDAHSLVMHAYTIESADSVVDHLAFHKALCVLMGWNYLTPPDNSKAYQSLSAHEAEANQDDLIMWPPSVLILNTTTGKGKEGRMEGLGNRAMDAILKDLGFTTGKSMSMYSREGHTGIHVVKFSMDDSGIKDALRMSDYFEREKHGRKAWAQVQSSTHGKDDESNPNLMKLDPKTGEKKRVFYGHLATVADLDKVTFEIKKKVSIVSLKAHRESK